MKSKLFSVQIRQYLPGQTSYGSVSMGQVNGNFGRFHHVETVRRTLRAEQIGNFCPLFCSYAGNGRRLVSSDSGDLSDPFRRTEKYAQTLFVELPQMSDREEKELRAMGLHPSQTGCRATRSAA